MATTEKNKGGQKAWTTEEQKVWLASLIPDYLASRSSNAPREFWPGLFEDWLQMWPLGEADAKEKEAGDTDQVRLKKLKTVSQCASRRENNLPGIAADKRLVQESHSSERGEPGWRTTQVIDVSP